MVAKLGAPEMIAYEGPLGHMATLKDGRIVSAYTSRLPDAGQRLDTDNPETPVYLRISHDNGLTWTEPYRAFTYPPGKGVTGSCFPLVAPDGTLHVLALRFYKIGGNFAAESKSHSTVLHNASADGGKTWTEIHNVDYGKRYTGALNSAIALNSGRLLLVLSSPSDRHGGRNVCVSTYSDDGGVTWHPSFQEIIVPDGELPGHPGALEPVVVELLDGRIWMIIRTQTGCFYQSCSTDDGVTWSDPTQTRFQAPNAPAGLCRLADKRIVLCWNDLSQYPVGIEGSQRQFLHIAISDDDGNTFGRSKEIARRRKEDRADTNVAYPFLCQAPDGHILVLYYRVGCAEGVTWWNPIIEVLRIHPDWIAAGG